MKAYQVFDENLINDNIKYKIGKKYRKSELLNQRPFFQISKFTMLRLVTSALRIP